MSDTQALLKEAQERIEKQQALLNQLCATPLRLGTVVQVLDKSVVVQAGGGLCEVELPVKAVKPGDTVQIAETGQIAGSSRYVQYGPIGTVKRLVDKLIIVEVDAGAVTVRHARVAVEAGDQVVLDAAGQTILERLSRETAFTLKAETAITWADIGGLVEAKAALRESVEMPYQHVDLFKKFNKKPAKGFLLHGRPGNGKTLLGKATATALAKVHGAKQAASAFIYVKGPEILSKWVGESEATIRGLFAQAREHFKHNAYPAVVFIDEADAILGARGRDRSVTGMEATIVPQFLSEMDGLQESCAIVLLATNRADMLDPAIVRPGRIDRKVYVEAPGREAAIEILGIHFGPLPIEPKGCKADTLATYTAATLFSDRFPLYYLSTSKGADTFHMHHAVSGAFLAGVVEQTAAKAIWRNITDGTKSGVTQTDVDAALASIYKEHCESQHYDDLAEWQERRGVKITGSKKVKGEHHGSGTTTAAAQ
jgi:proteasome-associated ATPase